MKSCVVKSSEIMKDPHHNLSASYWCDKKEKEAYPSFSDTLKEEQDKLSPPNVSCSNTSCDNNVGFEKTCMFGVTEDLIKTAHSDKPMCEVLRGKVLDLERTNSLMGGVS